MNFIEMNQFKDIGILTTSSKCYALNPGHMCDRTYTLAAWPIVSGRIINVHLKRVEDVCEKWKSGLRMEKKMMDKKLQEKKEEEKNRDTVATVT